MWCCCGPRQLSTRASGTWEARWRTILWSGSMRSGCKGKGRGRLTRGWGAGLTGGGGVDTAVNGLKNRTGYIWKNVLTTWHFLPGILPGVPAAAAGIKRGDNQYARSDTQRNQKKQDRKDKNESSNNVVRVRKLSAYNRKKRKLTWMN